MYFSISVPPLFANFDSFSVNPDGPVRTRLLFLFPYFLRLEPCDFQRPNKKIKTNGTHRQSALLKSPSSIAAVCSRVCRFIARESQIPAQYIPSKITHIYSLCTYVEVSKFPPHSHLHFLMLRTDQDRSSFH